MVVSRHIVVIHNWSMQYFMTQLLCPFSPPLLSQTYTTNREKNGKKQGAASGCAQMDMEVHLWLSNAKIKELEETVGKRSRIQWGDEWGGVVSTCPLMAFVYGNIAAVTVIAAVNSHLLLFLQFQ
ncbi:hypothetical protein OIU84_028995 [Salix udensis]|uniref:Uncharacterized protein n=1 Tax=Salix udensis TaxID=889485 RepID=A0AAD6KDX7_9ROSI|nr:hypothetical protein OIU84_028995 [Salix udensis]